MLCVVRKKKKKYAIKASFCSRRETKLKIANKTTKQMSNLSMKICGSNTEPVSYLDAIMVV